MQARLRHTLTFAEDFASDNVWWVHWGSHGGEREVTSLRDCGEFSLKFLINSLDYFELVNNTNHLISYRVANVRAAEDGVGILLQLKLGSKIDFATPRQKAPAAPLF